MKDLFYGATAEFRFFEPHRKKEISSKNWEVQMEGNIRVLEKRLFVQITWR